MRFYKVSRFDEFPPIFFKILCNVIYKLLSKRKLTIEWIRIFLSRLFKIYGFSKVIVSLIISPLLEVSSRRPYLALPFCFMYGEIRSYDFFGGSWRVKEASTNILREKI
ncbi:hypothetical protein CR513_52629, partial [Mucuna pruriens]